ncbi:hypothetical protein [Paraflavitalea pollutisoli]|uniref:hypothetical protein n=1 Tax=Paraflavitalea pollutisoli TaxID=3034143 RepID=UPI0023EB6153|nr:hypothetical protein [Paraflavitalea sp. H1-2-19X]
MSNPWLLILLLTILPWCAYTQDQPPLQDRLLNLPSRFNEHIQNKTAKLEAQVTRATEKYLERLSRKEEMLRKKLMKTDSSAAKELFNNSKEQYAKLSAQLKDPTAVADKVGGQYLPYVDSLKSSLSFLQQNCSLLNKDQAGKIASSLQQVQQLQGKLQQADQVKEFIRQRKEQIQAALSRYTNLPKAITKRYQDFQKELYYYNQQVQEYRDLLNDPDKLLTKTLGLLQKLPAFQTFLKEHSELASLFAVPAGYASGQSLAGLQTRDQVQSLLQNQLSAAGPNAQQLLQQNLQGAQAQLSQLKDKISKLGSGGGYINIPNFKPNNQKTKTFWKRLEYGSNLQTQKSQAFFPTTSDIGLSVGYKITDNSIVGVGGSYKVGWGKDIRNISISSQGAAIRSFLDVRLKGSFFASGGYEYNYQPLSSTTTLTTQELQAAEEWQQSGLLGVSKIVSLKSKFFKKTKLQLLWDFLSYQQVPKAQPLKFRVGYSF